MPPKKINKENEKNNNKENFVRGRFKEDISDLTADFTASLDIDKKFAEFDIEGSLAHLEALFKAGLIKENEKDKIKEGFHIISKELKSNKFNFDKRYEDIHINIEKRLIELIGAAGEKLHTGRSRNDQVSVDFRLYVKNEIKIIGEALIGLRIELVKKAQGNIETFLPGYTHLQHAQPVSLAHHLLAYYEMFTRDFIKLNNAYISADWLTLGSGALAGADFNIDRELEAKILGFGKVSRNSIDSVSDRDFAIEFNFALSMIALHLSRFCEELILWNSQEFDFVNIKDEFTTGSSIMPQKKNPDVLELIRGKAGSVISGLLSLFIMIKSLPLAYNRDMQEDKKPVMDNSETVYKSLEIFKDIIKTIEFKKNNMILQLDDDAIYATDMATYLVNKGLPFRKSHEIIGNVVSYSKDKNKKLSKIKINDYKKFSNLFENDIYDLFDAKHSINSKKTYGSTSLDSIIKMINNYNDEIKQDENNKMFFAKSK
ncbi:MAG: argininosuccinate lyase [Candidatus Acididesulfobacter diazotrophicus]|jgi:argininosuccinate lyase|uniref:Argininosuccinate lyase n=1 Tax=Candidatus Acididesulfobacter diazotrophicus TaxID=2597226 RepID=A0A519BP97_9DELT|nr:MAG: argininosuccinate lyase [Candidatus Acididesulfobacter diazotrophicus]